MYFSGSALPFFTSRVYPYTVLYRKPEEDMKMQNNGNNGNNFGEKAKNIFQKMYDFRVKVNKQDKPIINVSSIFALACLIFAPHVTIIGSIAALVMGYTFRFESEDMDNKELEERLRKMAQNVKTGAQTAAKSIQNEINKAREQKAAATPAEAPKAAEQVVEKAQAAVPSNEELLKDLQSHAQDAPMQSNPAATTFHSAYAASAGSVPVLKVEEDAGSAPEPEAPAAKGSAQ